MSSDVETDEVHATAWEFLDRVPTGEEVTRLLDSLPRVWGVATVDFIDYVQPLPQKKKVRKPNPNGNGPEITTSIEAYTLYVSVAGRVKMVESAQALNAWRVDVVPEPVTPTGVPGYLSFETRLVYRLGVWIYERGEGFGEERLLGVRHGTAWVPYSGGSNAAATNPYEKVETSALGRALAAWGFGVLPGSGIASVEEMAAMRSNEAVLRAQQGAQRGGRRAEPQDPQELLEETLALMEQVRQARGKDESDMNAMAGTFLADRLGVKGAFVDPNDPSRGVNWAAVKPGQLRLLSNAFRETLKRIDEADNPL